MPRNVLERCCAKLNLFLDVVGRRHDGFHELVTVFHEIDLGDELTIADWPDAPTPRSVSIALVDGEAHHDDVPAGPENLAARAAVLLLEEAGVSSSVRLTLQKNVPSGAGLGGGSADAAGALRGVNRLLQLDASTSDLERIAAAVGSDVAFLVQGGSAIGRGRGELLDRIPAAPGLEFALFVPAFAIATAPVFGALEGRIAPAVSPDALVEALASGDLAAIAATTHNALLPAALAVEPRLGRLLRHARAELGGGVQMTGSGSTLFLPGRNDGPPDTGGWPFATRARLVRSA